MKKILIPTGIMLCLLMTGTAMSMGSPPRPPGVDVVVSIPLLPPIVELREEPYYNHRGYYYYYDNDRWYYAKSKRGPWVDLPRGHYPKETRYKGKRWQHDQGHDDRGRDDRGRGNDDRGHDRDRRDDKRDHDKRRW